MLKKIKVFVASPSDVVKERKKVLDACDELNRTLGEFLELQLVVLDWCQVPPDFGNTEQLILMTLKPEEWDVFIGIFWMKFGSPTGVRSDKGKMYLSGTQQEFKLAYDRWKTENGQPRIMFYRCMRRPPNGLVDLNAEQYLLVEQFFKEFNPVDGEHPGLYRSYNTVEQFERNVRMDLAVFLIQSNPILRRRLSDMLPRHFLQVLLHQLTLSNSYGNQVLKIELGGELELVTDSEERSDFHTKIRANEAPRELLKQQLKEFSKQKDGRSSNVDCREWPLRYANGGVLPIVRVNGTRHLCLFYRETFPTGWNIANGGSDNYQEILNPERVLLREFSEELLIVDERERVFYCFRPGIEDIPLSYQTAAFKVWANRLNKSDYESYSAKELPIKEWIRGDDSVEVKMGSEKCVSKGYFLSITPDDNAIEVDRIAYVDLDLNSHHKILDGEGLVIGRIIGLFNENRFLTELSKAEGNEHDFYPDILFFEGERLSTSNLDATVETFRAGMQVQSKFGVVGQGKKSVHPFDLCPITRAVATRYAKWLNAHPQRQESHEANHL